MNLLAGATPRLHWLTGVAGVVLMLVILRLVRRRQLRAKYSLLWLAVGVAYAPDLLFLVGTLFLVLVVMHLSWEVSRLEDRSKILAEEVALMRAELREHTRSRDDHPGDEGRQSA